MPRGMWSGTISFGLVSVPVNLFPALRSQRVRLRMLDKDGTPLSRRYYCPVEGVEVHPEHLIRGYEIEPDKFVTVHQDELEALEPKKSRDIDLRRFVNLDEIEPLFFNRPYFLVPDGESNKAYRLLAQVMEEEKKAGIATFVMRDKEYLVAIIAENGILRAETLRFQDEIRGADDISLPAHEKPEAKRVSEMRAAIKKHTKPKLALSELEDAGTKRLQALIQKKRKSKANVVHSEAEARDEDVESEEPVDLIAAIKASMAGVRENGEARPRRAETSDGASKKPARSKTTVSKSRRTKSGAGAATGDGLNDLSKDELYERAQSLDISGRSSMTKAQLLKAIRSAS